MNNNYKKQNKSKFSHHFLTYATTLIILLFTISFSLIAEPDSDKTNTENTNPALTDSADKTPDKTQKSNTAKEPNSSDSPSKKIEDNNESVKQKEVFLKQIEKLENQRRKLSFEIYQMRVKLIKEDPELQSLQRSIMDMHRKMASKLNGKNTMKDLLDKAKQVDSQIIEAINKNKNLAPKEEVDNTTAE